MGGFVLSAINRSRVNMKFSSFVLSVIKRFRGNVGSELSRRFVHLPAPLALRELRCIGHRALAHNKRLQSDAQART